jgi:hypothetical protein
MEVRVVHLDDITGAIVNEAIQIHRARGPGLLESVYEIILASALVGAAIMKDGIKRVVNDLAPGESRLRVNR